MWSTEQLHVFLGKYDTWQRSITTSNVQKSQNSQLHVVDCTFQCTHTHTHTHIHTYIYIHIYMYIACIQLSTSGHGNKLKASQHPTAAVDSLLVVSYDAKTGSANIDHSEVTTCTTKCYGTFDSESTCGEVKNDYGVRWSDGGDTAMRKLQPLNINKTYVS